MKGQLSAEMLILIVVVMAVVGIAAIQLVGSAKETSGQISEQTKTLGIMTKDAIKSPDGGYCITPDDCENSNSCTNHRCG